MKEIHKIALNFYAATVIPADGEFLCATREQGTVYAYYLSDWSVETPTIEIVFHLFNLSIDRTVPDNLRYVGPISMDTRWSSDNYLLFRR